MKHLTQTKYVRITGRVSVQLQVEVTMKITVTYENIPFLMCLTFEFLAILFFPVGRYDFVTLKQWKIY